jgi:hypothetical protein
VPTAHGTCCYITVVARMFPLLKPALHSNTSHVAVTDQAAGIGRHFQPQGRPSIDITLHSRLYATRSALPAPRTQACPDNSQHSTTTTCMPPNVLHMATAPTPELSPTAKLSIILTPPATGLPPYPPPPEGTGTASGWHHRTLQTTQPAQVIHPHKPQTPQPPTVFPTWQVQVQGRCISAVVVIYSPHSKPAMHQKHS